MKHDLPNLRVALIADSEDLALCMCEALGTCCVFYTLTRVRLIIKVMTEE